MELKNLTNNTTLYKLNIPINKYQHITMSWVQRAKTGFME